MHIQKVKYASARPYSQRSTYGDHAETNGIPDIGSTVAPRDRSVSVTPRTLLSRARKEKLTHHGMAGNRTPTSTSTQLHGSCEQY